MSSDNAEPLIDVELSSPLLEGLSPTETTKSPESPNSASSETTGDSNTSTGPPEDLAALDEEYNTLIRDFCPRIYLHPDEAYMPCTPEYYMQHAELYWEDLKIAEKGKVTGEILGSPEELQRLKTLSETQRDGGAVSEYLVDTSKISPPPVYRAQPPLCPTDYGKEFNLRGDPEKRGGFTRSELLDCPLHARVTINEAEDCYEILYLFFYAFNGSYNVCGKELGAHDADFEHFRVKVARKSRKLLRAFFGSHGYLDGYWKIPSQMEIQDSTHVAVYIANHSHAVYATPGVFFRICFCANDKTSGKKNAIEWTPKEIILLQPPSNKNFPPWINYQHNFCIDGIGNPPLQDWWKKGDPKSSNTCCRRTCFSFFDPKCGMKPEFWCLKDEPKNQ